MLTIRHYANGTTPIRILRGYGRILYHQFLRGLLGSLLLLERMRLFVVINRVMWVLITSIVIVVAGEVAFNLGDQVLHRHFHLVLVPFSGVVVA